VTRLRPILMRGSFIRSFACARLAAGLACLLLVAPAQAAPTWTIEDGSAIRFTAYQEGAPVDGGFGDFTAEILFDPDDLAASRVTVRIDTASVATGHKDRDTALRSSSFLDAARWPSATFVSEGLSHHGGERYEARGRLTIRDVTREVVLPFQLSIREDGGRQRADAQGELTISRLDYGVGQGEWASTGTVGEEVVIRLEIIASAPR
jgi:polyisoprenoid-binding protein YceI